MLGLSEVGQQICFVYGYCEIFQIEMYRLSFPSVGVSNLIIYCHLGSWGVGCGGPPGNIDHNQYSNFRLGNPYLNPFICHWHPGRVATLPQVYGYTLGPAEILVHSW